MSDRISAGITGIEMRALAEARRFVSHFRSLPDEQIREKWIVLIDRAISQFRGADHIAAVADGDHSRPVGAPDTVAGGGQPLGAQEGQPAHASARTPSSERTVAGGGHPMDVRKDHRSIVSAGSPRPVAGQDQKTAVAQSDQSCTVRAHASHLKHLAGRKVLAHSLSLFDTKKASDGRSWGDVFVHELNGMDRDGAMARALSRRIGVLPTGEPRRVREVLKLNDFEDVCTQVELANAD